MIRPLLLTALCAFLAAIGFFSIAAATGGSRLGQFLESGNYYGDDDDSRDSDGPQTVKILTWDGGDSLTVMIPATVHYTQGPTTSLGVTGPKGTVERIVVRDGALRFDNGSGRRFRHARRVEVTMTAPNITHFMMMGSQRLDISGYKQDRLEAALAGSGSIVAKGAADRVEMGIAGSGDIDFGDLAAKRVEIHIGGSGDAVAAPSEEAEVNIAGSGDVTLKTRPKKLETHIAGSGEVHQPDA
jgi:hypothetical protein